jgi:heme a synthase
VLAVTAWAALRARRILRSVSTEVLVLLAVQLALGIANVAFSLPLALAAAHNAGAALLLLSVVVLNFFSFRGLRPSW